MILQSVNESVKDNIIIKKFISDIPKLIVRHRDLFRFDYIKSIGNISTYDKSGHTPFVKVVDSSVYLDKCITVKEDQNSFFIHADMSKMKIDFLNIDLKPLGYPKQFITFDFKGYLYNTDYKLEDIYNENKPNKGTFMIIDKDSLDVSFNVISSLATKPVDFKLSLRKSQGARFFKSLEEMLNMQNHSTLLGSYTLLLISSRVNDALADSIEKTR